ncbi:Vacuolar protein sorting-associated protein 20 [Malassezia japonica]|uniref:Vacuolar protein sorting-associated protein 20 n=1 Tax=Malassezia japonica TaxID=223818 RepID=A0AAF0EX63_9BASI|nr:Vacuolar protein sorting-associated protein 20 [Malassezia japonica]WFD38661.1 Vacuolar protein sorting-associated protein 20 [Malassezia japonica]
MGASSSKGPQITKQDRAVLDLKIQRDRVRQYQVKLQHVLDQEYAIARDAVARGDKMRAKVALQRRAYQRGLIEKTDQQLATLQGLVSTIEFAQLEQSIMYGLEQGNQVLKEIHKEVSIERVEELMDRTAEAQDYQREIDERLASQLTADEQEEVENELAALAAEAAKPTRTLPEAPTTPAMPAAPTSVPTVASSEQNDVAELQEA